MECIQCKASIRSGEDFDSPSGKMCEQCFMESRISLKRKTHWQYLRSPKSDYLRFGKPVLKKPES